MMLRYDVSLKHIALFLQLQNLMKIASLNLAHNTTIDNGMWVVCAGGAGHADVRIVSPTEDVFSDYFFSPGSLLFLLFKQKQRHLRSALRQEPRGVLRPLWSTGDVFGETSTSKRNAVCDVAGMWRSRTATARRSFVTTADIEMEDNCPFVATARLSVSVHVQVTKTQPC